MALACLFVPHRLRQDQHRCPPNPLLRPEIANVCGGPTSRPAKKPKKPAGFKLPRQGIKLSPVRPRTRPPTRPAPTRYRAAVPRFPPPIPARCQTSRIAKAFFLRSTGDSGKREPRGIVRIPLGGEGERGGVDVQGPGVCDRRVAGFPERSCVDPGHGHLMLADRLR